MLHDINFHAEIRPILDNEGYEIDPQLGRGVYRADTGELISICGPNTELVQHMQVVDPVLSMYREQGYTIEENPNPTKNDLYALRGKKGVFVSTDVADNGGVMRLNIISGDFVKATETTSFLAREDETMFSRVSIVNSHNSKLAVSTTGSWLRLKCYNGMVDNKFTLTTKARHLKNLNVGVLQTKVANIAESLSSPDHAERFARYARTRVNEEQAQAFFTATLARLPGVDTDGTPNFSEKLVKQLMDLWREEDDTAYGLWNAMTAWSTHGARRDGTNLVMNTIERESRVAATMSSRTWEDMLVAA